MRKIVPMAIAGGVLAATGGVFGAWTATAKTVDITVDGVPTTVTTHNATVGDVLKERGIAVAANDEVAPAAESPVNAGTQIVVNYSRDVTLNLTGGERRVVPTTALTVGELMDDLNYRTESKISAARSTPIGRQGMTLDVAPAREVALSVGGKAAQQVVTSASSVEEALREANVDYDDDDEVLPAKEALVDDLDAQGITVNIVDYKESQEKSEIEFRTEERKTSRLKKGTTEVQTEGKKGTKVETFREKFVNGQSVEKKSTGPAKTETEPVSKIVLVGTGSSRSDESRSSNRDSDDSSRSDEGDSDDSDSSGNGGDDGSGGTSDSPATQNTCKASYYWQGQKTANGEQFNPDGMTAAHKTLPFGTRVKVTNPANGKTVTVRINDRGPFIAGRCLDLSRAAMKAIDGTSQGVITVKWETV